MGESIRIFAGFDGTGNHKDNDERIGDGSQTHIAELYKLYDNGENIVFYERGVGTETLSQDKIDLVKAQKEEKTEFYDTSEMVLGLSAKERVNSMLSNISDKIDNNLEENIPIYIDVAGFSRGAASARDFVNELNTKYAAEIESGKIVIDNVILYDTVASIGVANSGSDILNLNLGVNSANNITQLVAKDELRENFSLISLRDKDGNLQSNMKEIELLGVHSNIGGGYAYTVIENTIVKSGYLSYSQGEKLKLKWKV